MESVNNPKSFLFLPPEIRLLIYRYLLIPEYDCSQVSDRYVLDPEYLNELDWGEQGVVFFDLFQKRKVRRRCELQISTLVAVNVPRSVLPLLLCNSIVHREAARVFFEEKTFRFSVRKGEADWDMLYGWLEAIGRRNICHLRHLEIMYDSIVVRFHEDIPQWHPTA